MRPWEIKTSIGKNVRINPNRDLGMNSEQRHLIGKTCTLVKQCKNGLLQVSLDGKLYSLAMTNVDLAPKLEDIDFDDEQQMKKFKKAEVSIPVGVLAVLLRYYYTDGREPDSNNERLQEAILTGSA